MNKLIAILLVLVSLLVCNACGSQIAGCILRTNLSTPFFCDSHLMNVAFLFDYAARSNANELTIELERIFTILPSDPADFCYLAAQSYLCHYFYPSCINGQTPKVLCEETCSTYLHDSVCAGTFAQLHNLMLNSTSNLVSGFITNCSADLQPLYGINTFIDRNRCIRLTTLPAAQGPLDCSPIDEDQECRTELSYTYISKPVAVQIFSVILKQTSIMQLIDTSREECNAFFTYFNCYSFFTPCDNATRKVITMCESICSRFHTLLLSCVRFDANMDEQIRSYLMQLNCSNTSTFFSSLPLDFLQEPSDTLCSIHRGFFGITCYDLPIPANGEITSCSFSTIGDGNVGDTCSYTCDTGYELTSGSISTCQSDGTWSGTDGVCRTVTCSALTNLINGTITCSLGDDGVLSYEDTCNQTCNTGFRLAGSDAAVITSNCLSDGTWSGSAVVCIEVQASTANANGLSGGAVVGLIIGCLLVVCIMLVILIIAAIYYRYKLRGHKNIADPIILTKSELTANPQYTSHYNSLRATHGINNPVTIKESAMKDDELGLIINNHAAEIEHLLVDFCDITVLEEIGQGAFGLVFKGEFHCDGDSVTVAIKTIKTDNWAGEDMKSFMLECTKMSVLDHPNVLGLKGICLYNEENTPFMLLPFMTNGDLKQFLVSRRVTAEDVDEFPKGMDETILLGMVLDIAKGMEYLSSCYFIHRDLAARNCMVDKELNVKVADFGLSRDIYESNYYVLRHTAKLPVKWMAVESILDGVYNVNTDVWSYGITCWEVFSLGRQPYPGLDHSDIAEYLSTGHRMARPSLCPDSLYGVMKSCWHQKPKDRPSFTEIVAEIDQLHQ